MPTKKPAKKAAKKTAKKKAVLPNGFVDPSVVVPKAIHAKALKSVNELLKANGKKTLKALPPGEPGDSCNCPIAIALKPIGVLGVGGDSITVEVETVKTETVTKVIPLKGLGAPREQEKPYIDTETDETEISAGDELSNPTLDKQLKTFGSFVTSFDKKGREAINDHDEADEPRSNGYDSGWDSDDDFYP